MQIDRLIEIAQQLHLLQEEQQLRILKERSSQQDCELILPIVGEFSSGKTTLINALLDSDKKLETATKETTATLFEIHFGCEKCYAEVVLPDGTKTIVNDFDQLKNNEIKDSLVVNVYDTSTRIPSSIIFVDTPGLSSKIAEHRQVLIDFLPEADAILLAMDINAQFTRSLADFINTMDLARRPVFLIITKCDTKSEKDVQDTMQYLAKESKLPLKQIVCISSTTNDLKQLYALIASIQEDKSNILEQVNAQRVKNITQAMLRHIDDMLNASGSDKELQDAIQTSELELRKIKNKIDRIISHSQVDINDAKYKTCRKFADTLFAKLDAIVSSQRDNYNAEAIAAINNVASITINEFKSDVRSLIMQQCGKAESELDFLSIQDIDLSNVSIKGLSYNLDLNSIGHEYDDKIAIGLKVAAATAAVVAVAATAGAAAPAAEAVAPAAEAAAEGGSVALTTGETVLATADVVDTVTDVGSMISNARTTSRIEQAVALGNMTAEQYSNIETVNAEIGQRTGRKGGFVEGIVGFVTDRTMGKPQRRRAIMEYIDGSLVPEFKSLMETNCQIVVNTIREMLNNAAQNTVTQKMMALDELKKQFETQQEAFEQHIAQLKDIKKELSTN